MALTEPRETRRRAGADRREQILREAMACFAEDGFRGTTIKTLAARVGISEAALYRYFPGKDALYAAIIAHKMNAVDLVAVLAPVAERRDDRALFTSLAREIVARVEADPTLLRLLYYSALEGHELAEPFFEARVKRLREFVADYVARRIDEGDFLRLDPVLAARAFLGMVYDHLNVRLVLGRTETYPQPTEEVIETFVTIFLRGMRAQAV